MARTWRPDHDGPFRQQFESNKKKILATAEVCGICGQPLVKTVRWPHPMCTVVDHIIPVDKGGHPSMLENLQAAHHTCNRAKSNKLWLEKNTSPSAKDGSVSNNDLPLSMDWLSL